MPTLPREKPQQWHRGQGTVAQSQQAGPGATRILGTKNWSGMSRNKNQNSNQIKPKALHLPAGIQGTLNPARTGAGCEQGWGRGAPPACWALPFCRVARSSQMCRSVPETITGPGLTGCPCRGFAPGPLTKPHSFTLSITSFYFFSVPSSTSYLSPNLLLL